MTTARSNSTRMQGEFEAELYRKSPYNLNFQDGQNDIVFNTLRRSILSLAPDSAQLYRKLPDSPFAVADWPQAAALLKALCEHGFLVPAGVDDRAFARHRFLLRRYGCDTVTAIIAPTLSCNLACPYCFERTAPGYLEGSSMSRDRQDAIIQFLAASLPRSKRLAVIWFGGEPLLCPDAISHMTSGLRAVCGQLQARFVSSIVTNGVLLTGHAAEQLAQWGVSRAQVTVDGARTDHDGTRAARNGRGTYETILGNLTEASRSLRIRLRVNVTRRNLPRLPELLSDLQARGLVESLSSIYFYPILGCGRCSQDLGDCRQAADILDMKTFAEAELELLTAAHAMGFAVDFLPGPEYSCYSLRPNAFVFDPGGFCLKCEDHLGRIERSVFDYTKAGTLDAFGLTEYRKWAEHDPYEVKACKACPLLPMCSGSCPLSKIQAFAADADGRPHCPPWKHNFEKRVRLYLKTLSGANVRAQSPSYQETNDEQV